MIAGADSEGMKIGIGEILIIELAELVEKEVPQLIFIPADTVDFDEKITADEAMLIIPILSSFRIDLQLDPHHLIFFWF